MENIQLDQVYLLDSTSQVLEKINLYTREIELVHEHSQTIECLNYLIRFQSKTPNDSYNYLLPT